MQYETTDHLDVLDNENDEDFDHFDISGNSPFVNFPYFLSFKSTVLGCYFKEKKMFFCVIQGTQL